MFPEVEVRYLHAVIVLAEELNFTRASLRLHITQPALSRQIAELEEEYRFHLFSRNKGRPVELTDAGRLFVEEARSALLHTERAIHLARAAHEGRDTILLIGHSPYADQAWISALLAIRLPLYPKLTVRLTTQFPMELFRSILAGELSLAIVTAPPRDPRITAVPFSRAPLYAALPETHPAARKERLVLQDLANDEWILFAKRVHPHIHDAVMDAARREAITPIASHNIIATQQAVYLVSQRVGVAIVTKPTAFDLIADGVVVKPLSEKSLWLETCLVMRNDDDSRMINEFARSFLGRCKSYPVLEKQMELPLSA